MPVTKKHTTTSSKRKKRIPPVVVVTNTFIPAEENLFHGKVEKGEGNFKQDEIS